MPQISNNGTAFYNRNQCRSYNQTITTALVALSTQLASEVIIYNKTGQDLLVFDNSYFDSSNGFLLSNNDSFVVRGVTNCNQVSAKTLSASGTIYFRTEFFSNNAY